jgi:hypothetical protein
MSLLAACQGRQSFCRAYAKSKMNSYESSPPMQTFWKRLSSRSLGNSYSEAILWLRRPDF